MIDKVRGGLRQSARDKSAARMRHPFKRGRWPGCYQGWGTNSQSVRAVRPPW
jgi:hypothetical protein